ncbi:MAG TPA: 2-hydroxyglutaryl-CoA dehydratase [Chloroflexi bacterium]|nr:2-hydroxyglutaryl-CoA dehydratase [Chloroflexota bacterium]
MHTVGVDVGAITAKAAVLENDELVATAIILAGYDRAAAATQVLEQAMSQAGIAREKIAGLIGTGYGRVQVPGADRTVTEITCHARGAHYLCPQTRTVIDIGGQDSKGISVNQSGRVTDFVMNDKCAAGTGRFLEVMAHALEEDLTALGPIALSASRRVQISSTCTVFAESEVITHLAAGVPKAEIIAGIHEAIAARVATMVGRIPIKDIVVMTGGVARNTGVAHMLEEKLGHRILVPEQAQLAGAIGAALIARG